MMTRTATKTGGLCMRCYNSLNSCNPIRWLLARLLKPQASQRIGWTETHLAAGDRWLEPFADPVFGHTRHGFWLPATGLCSVRFEKAWAEVAGHMARIEVEDYFVSDLANVRLLVESVFGNPDEFLSRVESACQDHPEAAQLHKKDMVPTRLQFPRQSSMTVSWTCTIEATYAAHQTDALVTLEFNGLQPSQPVEFFE